MPVSVVSQRLKTALPDLFSNLSMKSFLELGFLSLCTPQGFDKRMVTSHVQFPSLLQDRGGQAKAPNAREPLPRQPTIMYQAAVHF